MRKLNVLIGCEESQVLMKEFRRLGHNAYSCDLQDCSGGLPEYHLKMDIFEAISLGKWDLAIYHPTCTFMTNSGVRWLYNSDGRQNTERWLKLIDAILFFNKIKDESILRGIKFFALENPIPHKYAVNGIHDKKGIGKYSQLIQPWQFGETTSKATCLWLNNLPKLNHTQIIPKEKRTFEIHKCPPGSERAKIRSKTFKGIAKAIAEQYSGYVLSKI